MQADVEEVHGEKGGGEDQRNRDGDDHAGTQMPRLMKVTSNTTMTASASAWTNA